MNLPFLVDPNTTSGWNTSDYISDKSLDHLENIISDAFSPVSDALDSYDEEFGELEQNLSTALMQARNLMAQYRANDEMDERYVL